MRLSLLLALCAALMGGVLGEKSFEEGFEAVKDWVVANGGMVKATVKTNENGVRGLYTTEAIKKSERIAVITAASILNAGSSENHFTTTILSVLRELKDPHSRFRSAMDMLPKPHEVLNACNFPDEYLPLMTEWMVSQIKSRQSHFEPMLDGSARSTMEFTIPEVMGTTKVTVDDLKYACALATSRYASVENRARLVLVPIYDMANHRRNCTNTVTGYEETDELEIVAGEDLGPGEEICMTYGDHVRDDSALLNYGFLPDLEDPPRLLLQDHHLFDGIHGYGVTSYDYVIGLEENKVELVRLQKLAGTIAEEEAKGDGDYPSKEPGTDKIYDMLMTLRESRKKAVASEITRCKLAIKGYEYRQEVDPYDEEDEYLDEEEEDGDEYRDEL